MHQAPPTNGRPAQKPSQRDGQAEAAASQAVAGHEADGQQEPTEGRGTQQRPGYR